MVKENTFSFCPFRLKENIDLLNDTFSEKKMSWTLILKMFQGKVPEDLFLSLGEMGIKSVGSDELEHLAFFKSNKTDIVTWFLNYDGTEVIPEFVDVNLTHKETDSNHTTCIMLELDTERYGLPLEELRKSPEQYSFLGAYLNCNMLPEEYFYKKWANLKIPESTIQSLGTSVSFPIADKLAEAGINHFRIGELAFFGRNITTNEPIHGMRTDVFTSPSSVSYHFFSKRAFA